MQDAISNILNKYDSTGKYLDREGIQEIREYLDTGIDRVKITSMITSNSSKIIKEAATRLYSEQPELLRPGGNSYTTRKYAACLRDIDYYLRYVSYSLVAGNNDIINERLLDGLKETYSSLNVPIGPVVRIIQILKEIVINEIKKQETITTKKEVFSLPFDYISLSLSQQNV
uniref:Allophycocyanin beta 18 subunit n=1 Tax=Polysiphonia sertularioides TaxID=945028 RepID=A0A1Z1MGC5_9FLOR|nr:allophycocyanin beta 18 subunit [Polysiphonia sertularioides]